MTEKLRKLVELDYEKTLTFLDKMDDILFRIKNWAVTTNGAIFALAITAKNKYCFVVNFVLIFSFWLLELFYKCFHEDGLRKGYLMEELLSSDPPDEEVTKMYTFGLGHAIKLPSVKAIVRIVVSRNHMTFLYVILLILSVMGYCCLDKLVGG